MDYSRRQARLRWPKAERIDGTGRYASISRCPGITAKLFETLAEADEAKAFIVAMAVAVGAARTI
jgi:hypothetical protein